MSFQDGGDRFLKISDVEKLTCLSRSTILRNLDKNEFPDCYKIGNLSLWSFLEIQSWIKWIKDKKTLNNEIDIKSNYQMWNS